MGKAINIMSYTVLYTIDALSNSCRDVKGIFQNFLIPKSKPLDKLIDDKTYRPRWLVITAGQDLRKLIVPSANVERGQGGRKGVHLNYYVLTRSYC